jgi:uncharacterized membrane protein YfcA
MTPAAVVLAIVIGGLIGLVGGGGSLVAVPAFTFLLGLPAKQAVVASLAVVGFAAGVGAVRALFRKLVPPVLAFTVGGSAIIGALAGSQVGTRISDETQLRMLAIVMIAAAVAIWRQPASTTAAVDRPSLWRLGAIGITTGVITGIAGVGGGFLVVPALVAGARLTWQRATAASMLIIAVAAMSALAGYFSAIAFDWALIAPLAAIAAAATLGGATLASRLPQLVLQRVLAACLVVMGSWVWVGA